MNAKKKIFMSFLALTIFIPSLSIKAEGGIQTNENTAGEANKWVYDTCEKDGNGCAWWSENFEVEVALVDKKMVIVPGTKSVRFKPYNPYYEGNYTKFTVRKSGTPNLSKNDLNNPNIRQDISFKGMYTVNYGDNGGWTDMSTSSGVNEKTSEEEYYIYMGFAYEKAEPDDFTTYKKHREDFIKYIRTLERKTYVDEGGFKGNVSFLDFFLKVSGYTELWDYTSDYSRLNDLKNLDYYLIIEPIYTVSTYYNGNWHSYTGTAKRLGNILWAFDDMWANPDPSKNWFTIFNDFEEVRYNILCNFYDKSPYNNQTLRVLHEFDPDNKKADYMDPSGYIKDRETICKNPSSMSRIGTRETSNLLGWIQSPFGMNIVSLKYDGPDIATTTCNVSVSSCEDDLFKYEFNLTNSGGTDTYDCIYPNNMEADKLGKYFYHVGENGKELWCYDDVSYDFSELKTILDNKNFKVGEVLNLPNGKLTVNRTCYSKSSENDLKGYLEQTFKKDPGTYQDTLNFTFGNETYTYKRNTTKYNNDNSLYIVSQIGNGGRSGDGQKYYKYTSKFHYDYEIENASQNINGININNYTLSESIIGTNSIKFNTQFDNAIIIKKQQEKDKTYTNVLSANMDNAYGLSNKLYNELKSISTQSEGDTTGTKKYNSVGEMMSSLRKIELYYEENEKQSCELQTTIKKDDPLGDGLKFRVISLSNPFPARDGTGRMAGDNWINKTENNVYEYIQNNRNVNTEEIYKKEPLYTVTLDTASMIKVREYNKSHTYSDYDIVCEEGTGRKCISNFLRDTKNKYINKLEGTCANVDSNDTSGFYTCADKTEKSGG